MSDILDRAKAHYRDKLSGAMAYVEVPEWGDGNEPLKIYYKPMTLKQQDEIFKHVRAESLKSLAQTMITRSLNEDGTKMFRSVDMTELMRSVDASIIERICIEMADREDGEDAVKN